MQTVNLSALKELVMEIGAVMTEYDVDGFESLKEQLLNRRKPDAPQGESESSAEAEETKTKEQPQSASKKYVFRKGDQSFEIDEDAELEFMADKKPMKLQLRELKDRAAGDVAVKNRMHSLAEEKKRVQQTLKRFTDLSKTDPLGALEYISSQAKEADSEFEYNTYLKKLAEQAETLGKMDERERKNWELEKKLSKANEDLSLKEREAAVVRKKQEILEEYPEIGDRKFGEMVDAVLGDENLLAECENEMDIMNMTQNLIQETMLQADIADVIESVNPAYARNNELIFAIRDQVVANPDLDEEDVREIVREVLGQSKRAEAQRSLSYKQRNSAPIESLKSQGASDFEILKQQLQQRNQEKRTQTKR